jgi:hypothetical protein
MYIVLNGVNDKIPTSPQLVSEMLKHEDALPLSEHTRNFNGESLFFVTPW